MSGAQHRQRVCFKLGTDQRKRFASGVVLSAYNKGVLSILQEILCSRTIITITDSVRYRGGKYESG